jgi:hypothetical protein
MAGLYEALLAFQKNAPRIEKDAQNPHFKNRYPSLDALMPVVLAALNKCGLVLVQLPGHEEGNPTLTTRLVHAESGELVEATMSLLTAKLDPQGQGSALTYARRYALMSFLGLVADEDTDGQPASGSAGPAKRARKPEAKKAVSRPAAGTQEQAAPKSPSGAAAPGVERDNQDVPEAWSQFATKDQRQELFELKRELGVSDVRLMEILEYVTGQKTTAAIPAELFDKVMENVQLEAVPFT